MKVNRFNLLLLTLLAAFQVQAQNCLPNGITFNTQAQINSFHANYPGCTRVEGNVSIDPQPSGNITNLNGLSGLTFIGGDLTIAHCSNLNNLTGLSSLDSIGGSFSIFNTWGLNNLSALGVLKSIHGNFIFYDNHGFNDINGLTALTEVGGNVDIFANPVLNNLNGLNALTSIGGNLRIADNVALRNLNGLNGLTAVGSDVTIGGSTWQTNAAFTSLTGLDKLTTVGGWLRVLDNPVLQNMNGLGSLTTVKSLTIGNNQQLGSLAGMQSLNVVQELMLIGNNPMLTDVSFLGNFSAIDASLKIFDNTALPNLSALLNVTRFNNGFSISGSPAITNLTDFTNITQVDGEFSIENMDGLNNLHGLENINNSNGLYGLGISIRNNDMLRTLDGLSPNVSTLQYLDISGNAALVDLQGTEHITKVGNNQAGRLNITGNPLLESLNGLQNLTSVPHDFVIHNNPSLKTLSSLGNLTTVGSLFLGNNTGLSNLNGLGNLASLGTLNLTGNTSDNFNLSGMTSLTSLGHLRISGSTHLKDLAGFEGIAIKGNVEIEQNAALQNLNGLQGSTTINQLYVGANPALTSLTGLENVTKIFDGIRIHGNPLLSDLNGLSNLKTLRRDFFIYGNQSLSDCSIFGLCLFLTDPPRPDSVGVGNNAPGCNTVEEVSALCVGSYVTVEVKEDPTASCTGGFPVADMPVRLLGGPQSTLKPSDASGTARFRYLDTAPFEITLPQLNHALWNVCAIRQVFVAINGRDSTYVRLFLSPKVLCPELDVKLNLPSNFRGCLVHSLVRVTVKNTGTVLAEGGKLAVVTPPVFEILNTSPVNAGQNGDTLYFEFGDLKPFEKTQAVLTVQTKCDTFLLGQTLCWEAFAGIDNPCPQSGQAHSEIKLKAECIGGTIVRLSLKNIGDAPTQGWHEYRIIRNDVVKSNNTFSLKAQESLSFDFPADGATWRMEATKFDDGTQTAVALENCGGLIPGWITAFWLDHGSVEYDFDCRQVVQSYDPNRKSAVPTGAGPLGVISTGQPICYTIEFQNTGTDTAYRVLLRDVLDKKLDINTFRPGYASHPYTWEVRGDLLEVLFFPIMLPDSNVNEPASHGFFTFEIAQKPDLPDGTVLENTANIIFDFNPPIITNTVRHTIGEVVVNVREPQEEASLWQVLGNPVREVAVFRARRYVPGEKRFELYNAEGAAVRTARFAGQEFEFQRAELPPGLYFFRISGENGKVFSGSIGVMR